METPDRIRSISRSIDEDEIHNEVRRYLDDHFADLDSLLSQPGPSQLKRVDSRQSGRTKRKRGIQEELTSWTAKEASASKTLEETSATVPELLEVTQDKLQGLLKSAQSLSIERYALADKLANLFSQLDSSAAESSETESPQQGKTVLEKMEALSQELARLETGLVWVELLEKVVLLSEKTLSPKSHHPSPLAALPHFRDLNQRVEQMEQTLPDDLALLGIVRDLRQTTWQGLKDLMTRNLLKACEPLKWPLRVEYPSVPPPQRRSFERAFQDLLYVQAEGETIGIESSVRPDWSSGQGLYPIQAIVQPIALRFKYHFQGSRDTNRMDKPEWAFSHVLDQIFEHRQFVNQVLQPLADRAGFETIDMQIEFTMLLFPMLFNLLRSRIPHLIDHPALLAHTIYQTVVFDEAIREGGFDIDAVSIYEGVDNPPWEGLSGLLLRDEGWFQQWLSGEKRFADTQFDEIISSSEAWTIADEASEDETDLIKAGQRPTVSSRQVKALIEQITDRYAPLPMLEHRMPFLTNIQLPLLASYQSRISGSLDAFETLSSAFVRAVPGALAGNTRSGVHIDQAKLTGGEAGLDRLIKAFLSAEWIVQALKSWRDDVFFVEISAELREAIHLRWRIQNDPLIPSGFKTGFASDDISIFDVIMARYSALSIRVQDMIVRHISAEVESELKEHLKRRWDTDAEENDERQADTSLSHALSALSSHLAHLGSLPPITFARMYRRIVHHVSNHIQHRAVFAGWSKFSEWGGKDFADEVEDWIQTCLGAIETSVEMAEGGIPGDRAGVESPWTRLQNLASILSLPTQAKDGQARPTFSQAMAAVWSDGESISFFCQRMGFEMERADLQGVLRRRVECWR